MLFSTLRCLLFRLRALHVLCYLVDQGTPRSVVNADGGSTVRIEGKYLFTANSSVVTRVTIGGDSGGADFFILKFAFLESARFSYNAPLP